MKTLLRRYKLGLILGMLFGTFGIWFLAIASLALPVMETLSIPFLWPGKFLASFLSDGQSMSTAMILVLYVCMAVFYGIIGIGLHALIVKFRSRKV